MSDTQLVTWLQSRLTSHGFACGAVDGIFGVNTIAAMKAFKRSRGLPVLGLATQPTVDALRATSTGSGPRPAPSAPVTPAPASQWPLPKDVRKFFGAPGTGLTHIVCPYRMKLSWDHTSVVKRITLHEKVAASAERVLQKVAQTYSEREIADLGLNLFGGSYNHRAMRGGTKLSMHAFGIALDFDPVRNGLHLPFAQSRLGQEDAKPFWDAWEAEGWTSGGRAWGRDAMHVEATRRSK